MSILRRRDFLRATLLGTGGLTLGCDGPVAPVLRPRPEAPPRPAAPPPIQLKGEVPAIVAGVTPDAKVFDKVYRSAEISAEEQERVEKIAKGYGLDFFPTIFEILKYDQMNEIAAYGGFPSRYPHWRFGMEYEQLSKSYEYGLSKIYEMVINNNPSYAYLLEGNSLTDQKLVMAHVFAHVDFFKNKIGRAHV